MTDRTVLDESAHDHQRAHDRDAHDHEAHDHEAHDHDAGLAQDVGVLLDRRRLLGLLGGLTVAGALAACSSSSTSSTSSTSGTSSPTSSAASTGAASASSGTGSLTEVPDETAGPYPADGSNGPNSLDDSGIVRSDIRASYGTSTTVATGTPLTVRLTVRDAATGDARAGAAVYLWHADQQGRYSIYSSGLEAENYLRGVQEADSNGTVQFSTVFPGCYDGRWPHIHFEVYESLDAATTSGPIVKTSQIALPKETCEAVYGGSGYGTSVSNLSRTSLTSDMVFRDDGGIHQLASMSGAAGSGLTASLTIGV